MKRVDEPNGQERAVVVSSAPRAPGGLLRQQRTDHPGRTAELREWVVMWESDDGHHRHRYMDKTLAQNAVVCVTLPPLNRNVRMLHDPCGAYPKQTQCFHCKRVVNVADRCQKCYRTVCGKCVSLMGGTCPECSV